MTGEGGFMHGALAEFYAAVSQKSDLIVVNEHSYRAEHIRFVTRGMDRR